jgi:hypothetical protein
MERKYKPLRPAYANTNPDSDQDTSGDPSLPQKRKRVQVKVACDSCRIKKSACDGQRPICAACSRRGTSCTFGGRPAEVSDSSSSQTPQSGEADRLADTSELLALLAAASDDVALDILNQVKFQQDFSLSLAQKKRTGAVDAGVAEAEAIIPPDQDGLEFELMTRHPILYPAEAPLDGKLDPTRRCVQAQSPLETFREFSGIHDPFTTGPRNEVPEHASHHEEDIYPARNEIAKVDFQRWTKISIANIDGAGAFSKYFELDHPVLGLFDEELFLRDLCRYNTVYCSEFFVNALLAWAFVSITEIAKVDSQCNLG